LLLESVVAAEADGVAVRAAGFGLKLLPPTPAPTPMDEYPPALDATLGGDVTGFFTAAGAGDADAAGFCAEAEDEAVPSLLSDFSASRDDVNTLVTDDGGAANDVATLLLLSSAPGSR
jgi:hypothetical protein